MYMFPDTRIKSDSIKFEDMNTDDLVKTEFISKVNEGNIKTFKQRPYDPMKTKEISYSIFLNKDIFFSKIKYYTDKKGNKYYFNEEGFLNSKVYHNNVEKYIYKKNGQIAEIIDNKHQWIYIHTDTHTEIYDNNDPIKSRKTIDPIKDVRYTVKYFD